MRHTALLIGLIIVFAATVASAGARQHFMAGQDYYTQGRYQKAIDEFEEAYRLDPRSLLLFNIAQSYEKKGNFEQSVEYLKRFLAAEPDSDERTTLLNKIANLEARIKNTGVTLTSDQVEATVFIDEKEVGRTPISGVIQISTGTHKIRVSKDGFLDFKMNIAVASGQSVAVEVAMEPGQATPAAAAQPEEDPYGAGDDEEEEEEGTSTMDLVPWIVAGVGGATAIVGWGVLGGMALSADDHDQAVLADIIGGAGILVAAAGASWGLYNMMGGDEAENTVDVGGETAFVTPVVGPRTVGLAAVVSF